MSDHSSNTVVTMGSERSFGVVFAVVFAIIALWPVMGGGGVRWVALAIAAAFLALAYLAPQLLKYPNLIWFKFGMLLAAIIAPITMMAVYLVTFVPMGLALRLLGKDLLKTKLDREASSYWIERTDEPQSMKNQF